MALRSRAATISNLEGILENKESLAPGKRFLEPPNRAALGEIRNKQKQRSASVNDECLKELKPAAQKPRRKKHSPAQLPNKEVKQQSNVVENMDVSGVSELPQDVEDIDEEDAGNPQLVAEYVQDVYNYLRILEKDQSIRPDYLAGQQVILPKMRAVLVDWLVGVHLQFKLLPETVYTSVAILDRFMQDKLSTVNRSTLQLVGVAAMLVASKYEEIYAPEIKDFVYITDQAYNEKTIITMEIKILEGLHFNLGRPLPLHFLRRASKAASVEAITHTLAKYIMELSLTEYSLISEPPSRLAAAALALSIRLLEPGVSSMAEVWNPVIEYYTRYKVTDLTQTVVKLAVVLVGAPTAKLATVFQKYSSRKFFSVARIPVLDQPVLKDIADGNVK